MSIKIHHGPPGSYKTSGAVMDDFIPAARAGRVVVTNVRGLSSVDRVREALGDDSVPETFELHYLPTTEHDDAAANREALARWWHWLPHGALLLMDEAQMIWPKVWGEKDLKLLDFPGGLEASDAANRPLNWTTAFEMHRHYGWDMVLTTPNIERLRADVRQCSEGAYKHKNQAIIGLKGFYLEAFHMADDSGKSASDFMVLRNRRIKKEVWRLYDSTATGSHSDTLAGLSIFTSPRILVLLGCLASALGWFITSGPPAVMGGQIKSPLPSTPLKPSGSPDTSVAALPKTSDSVDRVSSTSPSVTDDSVSGHPDKDTLNSLLTDSSFYFVGTYGYVKHPTYLFEVTSSSTKNHFTKDDLQALGFTVKVIRKCHALISYGPKAILVGCRTRQQRRLPDASDDVGGAQLTAIANTSR